MQGTAPATAHTPFRCLHVGKKPWGAMSDPQPGETIFKGNPSTSTAGAAGTVQSLIGLATS